MDLCSFIALCRLLEEQLEHIAIQSISWLPKPSFLLKGKLDLETNSSLVPGFGCF